MTKNKLYIISTILLTIAIALPVCISCHEGALKIIDSISALIGACCGVITLLIAILLYNKYGIDKSITDKQLKVVFDIVDELKKTVVFALSTSNTGSFFARLNFWTTDVSEFSHISVHNYLDDTVYFKISYAHAFNHLCELAQEPFAPKEVSEAIRGIQLHMLSEVKQEFRVERYAILFANSEENVGNEDVVGKFNNKDMTLREYIEKFQKVKESIKTWLLGHGVDPKSINF